MQLTKSKKVWAVLIATLLLVPCLFIVAACGGPSSISVSTFDELVDALAGTNEIVKLADDIDVEEQLVVSRKVVLDLNGKTLSNEQDIWNEDLNVWSIITVQNDGDLTIRGDGKILVKENDCYPITVDGGHLVVENGEFAGNIHAVYVYTGTIEIKGGKYYVQQKYGQVGRENEYVLNLYDANREEGTASIVVTGRTFVEFNPANCYAEGEGTNFIANGYVSTLDEDADVPTYVVTKE